ncbi:MAG TPA: hypothetical protein RMH99_13910 [Sandaracinaceae bacterium LLY-WYZ-13_1]|nr:hypothetical protein [Sandaracinaceae bacterium LLY-WYZ-13_1]
MLLVPATARARIATNLFREPLERASSDVRACDTRHDLPEGRYVIGVTIDWTGKAIDVEVRDAPAPLSPAAESCLEAAYTRLAFPSWETPTSRPTTVSGAGRRSVVPPAIGRRAGPRRPGRISIVWPFVLTASRRPAARGPSERPRHPRASVDPASVDHAAAAQPPDRSCSRMRSSSS